MLTFKSSGGLPSIRRRVSELATSASKMAAVRYFPSSWLAAVRFSLTLLLSMRLAAAFHHVFVLRSPASPSLPPLHSHLSANLSVAFPRRHSGCSLAEPGR